MIQVDVWRILQGCDIWEELAAFGDFSIKCHSVPQKLTYVLGGHVGNILSGRIEKRIMGEFKTILQVLEEPE